jgi:hypothetical protein
MAKNTDPPRLSVIGPEATNIQPPRKLGPYGTALWNRIQAEFAIADAGGLELLCLAAQSLDRAESLTAAIEQDGAVVLSRGGVPRANPACRDELAARAFVAKTLERLGVTLEPIKPMGRPSRAIGWVPD